MQQVEEDVRLAIRTGETSSGRFRIHAFLVLGVCMQAGYRKQTGELVLSSHEYDEGTFLARTRMRSPPQWPDRRECRAASYATRQERLGVMNFCRYS